MTSVGGVEAQFSAFVHGTDFLVYAVYCFQNATVEFFELAEFGRFLDTVVLEVVEAVSGYE